ncbi:MAG: hypothetical protein WCZ47_04220 [Bacilli bacterium]|jgi:hypothetical protein|nr:hypothetical protein [Bacilli bacterium]
MYRLGFINPIEDVNFVKINETQVIYKAKSLNPVFPGLLDLAFWKIGEDGTCTNNRCNSSICPFVNIYIKQGL